MRQTLARLLPLIVILAPMPFAELVAQDLRSAASAGDLTLAAKILDKDRALINAVDDHKRTALHHAALAGHSAMIELLVARGADIDRADYRLHRPLHHAVRRAKVAAARALIEAGADLEGADARGRTPLILCARDGAGDVRIAKLLLDAKADIRARDHSRATALELAAWRGYEGMVDLLLARGAPVDEAPRDRGVLLRFATGRGLPKLFRAVTSAGPRLELTNDKGGTLLHSACEGGSREIVSEMLRQRFDPTATDRYGWTPLHYAAFEGHGELVKLLVTRGAEADARSLSGQTPLLAAQQRGHTAVVAWLTGRGAGTDGWQLPDTVAGPYFGQEHPRSGAPAKLFAVDIVSTPRFMHGSISFMPNGRSAVWTSSEPDGDSGYSRAVLMSSRETGKRWSVPRKATIGSSAIGDVPFISVDGKTLYFISRRGANGGPRTGQRIWKAPVLDGGFGRPELVAGGPNRIDLHWSFSVARNGSIYVGSFEPGGLGGSDIYVSRLVDGKYTRPENLGNRINGPGDEDCPYIAPDESYLIYACSGRDGGLGSSDLYISFRTQSGEWTTPRNLGPKVNSRSRDNCPVVTADGKYLFFNSHRNGNADTYWVDASVIK